MQRLIIPAVLVVLLGACSAAATTTTAPAAPTTLAPATTRPPVSTTLPATTSTTALVPSTTTTSAGDGAIEVTVAAGAVTSELRREVTLGAAVRIVVTADVADEVHLHGYDLTVDVEPGQPAVLEFVADIPGIFEMELEGTRLEILELTVQR